MRPADLFAPADRSALHAAVRRAADLPLFPERAWQFPMEWTRVALPAPRPHPAALGVWAAAGGTTAEALRALLAEEAWLADDGGIVLWPWYPEEDAEERPRAIAAAARTGAAVPGAHLDEPWDPSWYFARSGPAALARWLGARGIDPAEGELTSAPIPPRRLLPRATYEGGLRAHGPAHQAFAALVEDVRWLGEGPEELRRVDELLGRAFAALGGPPAPTPHEDEPLRTPEDPEPGDGRLGPLWVVDGGLLIGDGEGWRRLDPGTGALSGRLPGRLLFAARAGVLVASAGTGLYDLAGERWCEGSFAGHGERTLGTALPALVDGLVYRHAPVPSACGRYQLQRDEGGTLRRLADDVVVGEIPRVPGTRARPLVDPEALAPGAVTVIGRVRFTVRRTRPCVVPGTGCALVLAGDRWRWLAGEVIVEGRRALGRIGVPVHHAAFAPDGSRLWALADEHLLSIGLADGPRLDAVIPLARLREGA